MRTNQAKLRPSHHATRHTYLTYKDTNFFGYHNHFRNQTFIIFKERYLFFGTIFATLPFKQLIFEPKTYNFVSKSNSCQKNLYL